MPAKEMRVDLRRVEGTGFVARADSGHWVMMDTPAASGGSDGAATPMELVLMSLAGCTGVDVVNILTKMRADLRDLRVEARAERAEGVPKVFTKIELTYHLRGNLEPRQVERAISLSHESYCSVGAMLKPNVQIEYKYDIETAAEPVRKA